MQRGSREERQGIIRCLVAVALLGACGDGGGPPPSQREPTRTPTGTPLDAPVTQTIGAAGGSVASADGKLTVSIPAGALSGDVPIGIQRITAEVPGASGDGYRLTPDGTTFAQPVSLAFSYDDADLEGTAAGLLFIASQEVDGAWRLANDLTLDESARMITARTLHFSDWTMLRGAQIRPPTALVKPRASLALEVKICVTEVQGTPGNGVFAVECETPRGEDDLRPLGVRSETWAVNGVRGGSSSHGYAAGSATAEYVAPNSVPSSRNPVAVSVDIQYRSARTQLVSNITIGGGNFHVVASFNRRVAIVLGPGLVEAGVSDAIEADVVVEIPTGSDPFAFGEVTNAVDATTSLVSAAVLVSYPFPTCGFMMDGVYEHFTSLAATSFVEASDVLVTVAIGGGRTFAPYSVQVDTQPIGGCVSAAIIGGTLTMPLRFMFDPRAIPAVGDEVEVTGAEGWEVIVTRR